MAENRAAACAKAWQDGRSYLIRTAPNGLSLAPVLMPTTPLSGACGLAIAWLRVATRFQVATNWEGVDAGHDVPYVDFA